MSILAAARQRRWYKDTARSNVFEGCIFFVQINDRTISESNADLALIHEHSGLVISQPFCAPFPPTHVILDVPTRRKYLTYVLQANYPLINIAEWRQPYCWTFEDLLAYALVRRAAGFPVTLMQSPWLHPATSSEVQPEKIHTLEKSETERVPLAVRSEDLLTPCSKAIKGLKRCDLVNRDIPSQQSSISSLPFLPISARIPSIVSKSSKPRAIIPSGLVREGQRPAKKGRMLKELRDSAATALELQPRAAQAHKKVNTSLLSIVTAPWNQLSDIFQGAVAFLDDTVLDRRNVRTYFTDFGGEVTSDLQRAKFVVLFIDSTFDPLSDAQRAIVAHAVKHRVQVVSQEWILESLSKDKLLSLDPFLLHTVSATAEPSDTRDITAKSYQAQFGLVANLVIGDQGDRGPKRKRRDDEVLSRESSAGPTL
ncbi:hypothetical protein CspHIS471_0407910 [Cutaneotrichosporon sp. HIS471]|nr:hypothetical protein CspHIS471_0407910 [Cutaneotrichosporon sp. HIS471]